jgi:hypothetical protein
MNMPGSIGSNELTRKSLGRTTWPIPANSEKCRSYCRPRSGDVRSSGSIALGVLVKIGAFGGVFLGGAHLGGIGGGVEGAALAVGGVQGSGFVAGFQRALATGRERSEGAGGGQ